MLLVVQEEAVHQAEGELQVEKEHLEEPVELVGLVGLVVVAFFAIFSTSQINYKILLKYWQSLFQFLLKNL